MIYGTLGCESLKLVDSTIKNINAVKVPKICTHTLIVSPLRTCTYFWKFNHVNIFVANCADVSNWIVVKTVFFFSIISQPAFVSFNLKSSVRVLLVSQRKARQDDMKRPTRYFNHLLDKNLRSYGERYITYKYVSCPNIVLTLFLFKLILIRNA